MASPKSILRNLIPDAILGPVRNWRDRKEQRTISDLQALLDHGTRDPAWLGAAELEKLCTEFPFPTAYGYDEHAVEQRGIERSEFILRKLRGEGWNNFLDLACFDGMTAAALQRHGKTCSAIDLVETGFDTRARHAGVAFAAMDATALSYPDDRFDVVYSFNAFEHFADPEHALHEALRVVRPGGLLILRFGPLYGSAKGLHAYDRIPVPYCQFLFPLAVMNTFLSGRSMTLIDEAHCNGWQVQQFRDLWNSVAAKASIQELDEFTHLSDIGIVQQYPSCFRGKKYRAEDLVVNIVEVVLKKL